MTKKKDVVDSDELQHKDELDVKWVKAWKKKVKSVGFDK